MVRWKEGRWGRARLSSSGTKGALGGGFVGYWLGFASLCGHVGLVA